MSTQTMQTVPFTDILECEDGFHIYMDIPGVPAEALSIELEENELKVRGKSLYGASAGRPMRSEFEPAPYERAFTLSDLVDRENIRANVKDGVLDLFLPKAESTKPRRIEIRAD